MNQITPPPIWITPPPKSLYGGVPAGPLQDQLMYENIMMQYNKHVQGGGGAIDSIKDFIGSLIASGASKYFTRTSGRGASIKVPTDSNNYNNVMRTTKVGVSF